MSEIYEFADFRLDVRERVLSRGGAGGERVPIPDKAFDTLCLLVRNAGRLVGKEELLQSVWADSFVEENNLNKSIHAIRRVLGENGDQKFIETVKKHGFRFVADVRKSESLTSPAESEASEEKREIPAPTVREFPHPVTRHEPQTATALRIAVPAKRDEVTANIDPPHILRPVRNAGDNRQGRHWLFTVVIAGSIAAALFAGALIYRYADKAADATPPRLAVLPLKPLDANDNYLGLGVADAIIQRLSQMGTLTVRPTSAVRRYLSEEKDALTAARELEVDVVLEGTIQRAEDRLRVTVNLLRVSDGRSLWADNFDMKASDAFAIQDRVARQAAMRLQLRLDPTQQNRSAVNYMPKPISYEYYLKGVYSFDQRWYNIESKPQMETTIGYFKRAIDDDPNFALAHAQLAYAYAWMAVYIDPNEQAAWVDLAKQEIARADALDPQLAETHIARHHILLSAHEGFQLEAAVREALLARERNPNVGAFDLAAGFLHLGLEDLFEREKTLSLEIDPTSEFNRNNFGVLYMNARKYDDWLAYRQKYFDGKPDLQYLLGKGRLDEAQQEIGRMLAAKPDLEARTFSAVLSALRGDHSAAEAELSFVLGQLPLNKTRAYHHATYNIACIYALGGKSSEAVKWLRETAVTGFPHYPLFDRDPFLDAIRHTPEFVQFMAELRPQYERVRREFAE